MFEWNETIVSGVTGSGRGLRGGCYDNLDGDLASSARDYGIPFNGNHIIGFRVASVPEPASLGLLTLGGLALLKRRRR